MAIKKKDEALYYIEAKKKVEKLKGFYVHLAVYLVTFGFIIWNLIIIEDIPQNNLILVINYSTIFIWGFFILLYGVKIFKGKSLFNKKWEDKKMKAFMGDKDKTWE